MSTGWCRRVLLLSLPLALLVAATAQDTQRVEVFGGYSLLHDSLLVPDAANFSGWDASTTVFLNRWFGATADFSGHYGSSTQIVPAPLLPGATGGKVKYSASPYTFMFGPHFTYRRSRYAPFAQALFGATHTVNTQTVLVQVTCPPASGSSGPIETCSPLQGGQSTSTDFSMALGGGLDIDLGHGISLRPVEADYILQRVGVTLPDNGTFLSHTFYNNHFRYAAGVVFHFGPHLGSSK
jgi:hypothetical protein